MKFINFVRLSIALEFLFLGVPAFAMVPPEEEDCDLRKSEVLRPLLSSQFQGDEYENVLARGKEIANRTYESKTRAVGGGNAYGLVFPMHPEVLKPLMVKLKDRDDKIVLEIAGASGENALLLALAGPRKVYLNDIEEKEIKTFEVMKKILPPAVRDRLESISGSVFDILTKRPELHYSVDHILCRNFLHFLKDTQVNELFDNVLNPMIKSGGELIFTMNSPYNHDALKAPLEAQPGATRFQFTQCLLTIFGFNNDAPCHSFFEVASVCDEDLDPLEYVRKPIYEIQNYRCIANTDNIFTYNSQIQQLIKEKITSESMGRFKNGRITIVTNTLRAYSLENVSGLFESHGFQVEDRFFIAPNGHKINPENPWDGELSKRPQQVGIIARRMQ